MPISENLFLSTLLWAGVYQLCQTYIKDIVKSSRTYSTIHALTTFSLSVAVLLAKPSSEYVDMFVSIPMGYAIIDTLSMLQPAIYEKTARFTIPHHIMLICSLYATKGSYPDLIAMGLLSEITNPLVNTALSIKESNRLLPTEKNDNLFVVGCFLIPLFFIFRVMNFTGLSYLMIRDRNLIAVPTVLLTILNYYWFNKIIKKAKNYL